MKSLVMLALLPMLATAGPEEAILDWQTQAPLKAFAPNPRHPGRPWIRVDIATQTLQWFDAAGVEQQHYTVSTARRGPGEQTGSYQTPRGWHRVCDRIGENAAPGTIIFRRTVTPWMYSPELHRQYPDKDWILTRILWLCGEEAGINQGGQVDSHDRAIYIHGAGEHVAFGTPTSLGCVRMRNPDIIDLFARTAPDTDVRIDGPGEPPRGPPADP